MPNADRQELVVVLVTPSGPGSGGGTQQVLLRMIPHWASNGRVVSLLTFPVDERWESLNGTIEIEALSVPPAAAMRSSFALIASASSTVRSIRRIRSHVRQKPAAVVLPFLPGTSIVTLLATIGLPNPVIPCERNDPSRQHFSLIVRFARRLLYRRSAAVTVNSDAAVDSMRRISGPKIPIHVVVNPLPDWDRTSNSSQRENVVLSIGRLVPQKRHSDTMHAFAQIANERSDWFLQVVGDGPEREGLEQLAQQLGIAERVSFLGYRRDVASILAQAKLLVLASEYEGTPNVLLEGLLSGTTCIVSDAIPQLPAGLKPEPPIEVFPVTDVDALAKKLRGLTREISPRPSQRLVGTEGHATKVVASWEKALRGSPQRMQINQCRPHNKDSSP